MRILEASLVDFGPHSNLNADLDAPVVGILGPNGTGKSTLLRALRFAFTGLLDDPAETYVRDFSDPPAPNTPSNGHVTVRFSKGGQVGKIFRQVGKSPRQYMEWGDRTGKNAIKSAAEIRSTLASILSADHQALDNAVFVAQGDLQSMLFGEDAAREKLFARMLLVSFCGQIHEQLSARVTALSTNLKDLTTTRDEAVGAVSAARQELHRLIGESNAHPEIDATAIQAFNSWATESEQLVSTGRAVATTQQALNLASVRRSEAAATYVSTIGVSDTEAADAHIAALDQRIKVNAAKVALLDARDRAALNAKNATGAISVAEAEVQQSEGRLAESQRILQEGIPLETLEVQLQSSTAAATAVAEFNQLTQRLTPLPLEQARLQKELAELQTKGLQLAQDLKTAQLAEALPRMKHDLLSRISGTVGQCCPVCDSKLDADGLGPKKLAEAKAALDAAVAETQKVNTAYLEARNKYTELDRGLAQVNTQLSEIGARRTELLRKHGVSDIQQLSARIIDAARAAEISGIVSKKRQAKSELSLLENAVVSARARRDSARRAAEDATQALRAAEQAASGLDRAEVADTTADMRTLDALRQRREAWVRAHAAFEQAENAAKSAVAMKNLEEIRQREATGTVNNFPLLASVLSQLGSVVDDLTAYVQRARDAVDRYQRACAEHRARLSQQERVVGEAERRQAAVDEAIARNDRLQNLVDDLRQLMRLFHRDGLPIYYMRQRFGEIVDLTGFFLAQLDSDFVVRPDPNRAMAFQFAQMSSASDAWLSQDKLSGGQRVRLSVACLLAISQLVIPDVGLLILDEPSMHLDDAGKESLSEMLSTLSTRLNEQDSQLVVCDHSPEVINALKKRVVLRQIIRPPNAPKRQVETKEAEPPAQT